MSSVNFLVKTTDANSDIKNLMLDEVEDQDSRLHQAAIIGNSEGMQLLLQEKKCRIELNSKVRLFGATPLRLAVTGGNPDCVKLLVLAGAQVDLEDRKGQTPLFVATSLKNSKMMRILLAAGANPNGSPMNRGTPLLIAIRDGFIEGVNLLLEYETFTEPPEYLVNLGGCGWALHHAVVYTHFHCFLALLRHGAIPNLEKLYVLKDVIRGRLSIPHAIMKYSRENPEFARLYYECGGDLRQPNPAGLTAIEENKEESKALNEIRELITIPLSLKASCRLNIRRIFGRKKLSQMASLELPIILLGYLRFAEYSYIASISESNNHIKLTNEHQG